MLLFFLSSPQLLKLRISFFDKRLRQKSSSRKNNVHCNLIPNKFESSCKAESEQDLPCECGQFLCHVVYYKDVIINDIITNCYNAVGEAVKKIFNYNLLRA